MKNHDWSKFTSKIYINATPENVCRAWLTAEGMEGWFLKRCQYGSRKPSELAQSGDDYSWSWYTKNDYTEKGKLIEAQSPNGLKFTFGPTTCALTIREAEGATLVELEQTNIPTDEKGKVMWNVSCQTGWSACLLNLKAYLEHKLDLREKDPRRLYDCSEYSDS